MAPKDLTNPNVILCLLEAYEKENKTRMRWIFKNRDLIGKVATLQREPKNYNDTDVLGFYMKEGMAALERDHKESANNRLKSAATDKSIPLQKLQQDRKQPGVRGTKDNKVTKLDTPDYLKTPMRPIEPDLKEILYKPKPEFGRRQYLDKRYKIMPEDKYFLPECTSWIYGWCLKDSTLLEPPKFGSSWQLMRSLKHRTGAQPDPPYY